MVRRTLPPENIFLSTGGLTSPTNSVPTSTKCPEYSTNNTFISRTLSLSKNGFRLHSPLCFQKCILCRKLNSPADGPHTFTSVHSERNAAEIHCLRRLTALVERKSFAEQTGRLVGVGSELSGVVQARGKNMWTEADVITSVNHYVKTGSTGTSCRSCPRCRRCSTGTARYTRRPRRRPRSAPSGRTGS